MNPRGLVPAVSHLGEIHVESLDIIRWADTKFSTGPLLAGTAGKARQDQNISAGSRLIDTGLSLLSGSTGRYWGIGSGQTPQQKQAFEKALQIVILDPLTESGGPFLQGNSISLADISVYPFLKRFSVAFPEFCGGYDVCDVLGGGVGMWLRAVEARPAAAVTTANDDLLLKALRRHKSLDFFDYDSYLACDLHPHNEKYYLHNEKWKKM